MSKGLEKNLNINCNADLECFPYCHLLRECYRILTIYPYRTPEADYAISEVSQAISAIHERQFERRFYQLRKEYEKALDEIGRLEDKAKDTPLTPEQVEELKEKDYPQLSVTKVMVAGDLFDYGKKIGKNEAISHINANYWLIPKKEGEVNAD